MTVNDELDLVIARRLRAPRASIWKAWADPGHLRQWWCPKPWTTEILSFDLRPGGNFHTRMHGPDGETSDNPGAFLEIVPLARIVWTSTLVGDWRPAAAPWMPMTAFISFDEEGEDTRYVATVRHQDKAGRDRHEQMGFFEGWGICADQLEAYAQSLK